MKHAGRTLLRCPLCFGLLALLPFCLRRSAAALEIAHTENQWQLMERDGVSIDLIEYWLPDNGGAVCAFKLHCQNGRAASVLLHDFLLSRATRYASGAGKLSAV